jgi:hypothetical protein
MCVCTCHGGIGVGNSVNQLGVDDAWHKLHKEPEDYQGQRNVYRRGRVCAGGGWGMGDAPPINDGNTCAKGRGVGGRSAESMRRGHGTDQSS